MTQILTTADRPTNPAALAEQLRRAADVLETKARAAAPHGMLEWRAAPDDRHRVVIPQDSAHPFVAYAVSPEITEYISVWSPPTGVTIAYMLRQVARELDSYDHLHCLPPDLRRLAEKRAVWAGEIAGCVLRSTMDTHIPGGDG